MLALILIFSIAGCSGDKQANQSNQPAMSNAKSIKLGTLVTLQPFMVVLKDELVKKGYNVELVLFDANNMPATATKDGNIDGFIHNHLPWIKTFNQQNNSKLEMMRTRTCFIIAPQCILPSIKTSTSFLKVFRLPSPMILPILKLAY